MADCTCENTEVRDVIDLYTPLYQACGGRLYRLHVTTDAKAVLMGDGVTVETRLNSLERNLLANTTTYFADTIAKRDAIAPLSPGDRCYVANASADATVPYGSAMYIWMPTREWKKLYNGDTPLDCTNIYKPGGGLNVEANKLVVKLSDLFASGAGLALDNSGKLKVDYATGSGLALDGSGKLKVDVAAILGNGFKLDSSGKAALDLSKLPTNELQQATSTLIKAGAGLKVGSDGRVMVDLTALIGDGLKVDSNGRAALDFTRLPVSELREITNTIIQTGGGLSLGEDGKLNLDFNTMPAEKLQALVLPMIQAGGGLQVKNGKIYFDADSMDKSVFEKMLKALKMMIPLESNKYYNVDINHANASDTLDEGRGLSADKPFRTIQACVDFICKNYGIGNYTVYINIADGNYDNITLPDFSRTTGTIRLRANNHFGVTIGTPNTIGTAVNVTGGEWYLQYLNIQQTPNLSTVTKTSYVYGIFARAGRVHMLPCKVKITYTGTPGALVRMTAIADNVYLYQDNTYNSSIEVEGPDITNMVISALLCHGNCNLGMNNGKNEALHDFYIAGNFSYIAYSDGGMISTNGVDPVKMHFTNSPGKTITGTRFNAANGGHILTYGGGPEFFPGTKDGVVDASTYSWYK